MRDWVTKWRHALILGSVLGATPTRDGARLPGGHRPRGGGCRSCSVEDACPAVWPASEEAATPSGCSTPSWAHEGPDVRCRGRGNRLEARAACRPVRGGSLGVLQGTRTFLLQDEAGNIQPTTRLSPAGLRKRSGPSTRSPRSGAGPLRSRVVRGALQAFHALASWRGSSRRSNRHCGRLRFSGRGRGKAGRADHRQPVGTRRQGRGELRVSRRRRGQEDDASTIPAGGRIARAFDAARGARRRVSLTSLHHRGGPGSGEDPGHRSGIARRGRTFSRSVCRLSRPDRRRTGEQRGVRRGSPMGSRCDRAFQLRSASAPTAPRRHHLFTNYNPIHRMGLESSPYRRPLGRRRRAGHRSAPEEANIFARSPAGYSI